MSLRAGVIETAKAQGLIDRLARAVPSSSPRGDERNGSRLRAHTTGLTAGPGLSIVVGAVAVLILSVLLFDRFAAPPLWDAAWSTSAGAAELSRNGFDYSALLSSPPFHEGGPGTHASSLLTPVLGGFFVMFGSPGGLIAGHVLMVGIGGALVAATFSLARRFLALAPALAAAGAVLFLPVIVQQVADPYIELPLALFTVLAVIAFLDGSRARLTVFAALAIWFKPTGLIVLPLIALIGDREETGRWVKNGLAILLAAAPFSIAMLSRSMATHAGAAPTVEGTLPLLVNAFWILGVTTDVLVILTLFCIGSVRQRRRHPELIRPVAIVTAGFFALQAVTTVLSQAVTILPRYYVVVLPLWLVVVGVELVDRHTDRVAVGAMAVLMAFSLLNWNGTLYPLPDHPQAPLAERTPGGGQIYLEMEMEGTRVLAETADGVVSVVSGRAMQFRLEYPELGFVSETPENIVYELDFQIAPPGSYAWIEEPHVPDSSRASVVIAEEEGWHIATDVIWDQRWRSELVVATTP